MAEDKAPPAHTAPFGTVLLPLACIAAPAPGALLRVQATDETSGPGLEVKCRVPHWRPDDLAQLRAALAQGVHMVRMAAPQQRMGPRTARVVLELQGALSATCALGSITLADLQPWAAAAGALADRIYRGQALDWAHHTLLLAGMDLDNPDPQQWGRLQPLSAALEEAALEALCEGATLAPELAQALVVLPGDEARYAGLRRQLSQRLPGAKVCCADSLTALTSPDGHRRQPRLGQAWFPLARVGGAVLHRLQVWATPWQPSGSEAAPVEVVFHPAAAMADQRDSLAVRVADELRAWRNEEPTSPRHWHTLVQLPTALKQADGPSYQLALAVADRMARGREWQGPGRLLATGKVSTDQGARGRVENVSGNASGGSADKPTDTPADKAVNNARNDKLQAFAAQAQPGDTLLLPHDELWMQQAEARFGPLHNGRAQGGNGVQLVFVQQVVP